MSLLDSDNFIEITLYYKYISFNGCKKVVVLEDVKAEELLKDKEKAKEVESITTKWSLMSWREQNEILNASSQPTGPNGEKQFNFLIYRDFIVKKCLKEWNITLNEKPVPVTKEAIDRLPGNIVSALYQKFEKVIDYTEEELGN